ncbi:hypothetical protein H5410_046645, partial [Solanum commersonii]
MLLNSYGSALDNKERIGVGGIVRDVNGAITYGYATLISFGTNNHDEFEVVTWGLSWCLNNGYWQQPLGTCNMLLIIFCTFAINLLLLTVNIPLERLILTKTSHQHEEPQHFFHEHQLPKEAIDRYCIDKIIMANLRRRKLMRIKEPSLLTLLNLF